MTPENSTSFDLVELTRRVFKAFSDGRIEQGLSLYAADAVYESAALGTAFAGRDAIRDFMEDWTGAYQEFEMRPEEVLDPGGGITLAVVRQRARPLDSPALVELRFAAIAVWQGGLIARAITYTDIDEARAAAERLARDRS